ncbi:MAG: hypothetical protein II649_08890 [Kiritimatiellae bacterium]|nr:hypothetical protein [Kiritimatiellia bacterium]
MDKITLQLHPCSGSVKEKGCYLATVATGRGNAVDLDEMIEYAIAKNYVTGAKSEMMKANIRGFFDSIIAGMKEDGRVRRIDDYLSISIKVHGRFEDAHDEFDPSRHSLTTVVTPIGALQSAFKDVLATNPKHKRQFRIYSARAADVEKCQNRHVVWKHDILVKGADFPLGDSLAVFIHVRDKDDPNDIIGLTPRIIAQSDTEVRLAWPKELCDKAYSKWAMEITLCRMDSGKIVARREIQAIIQPE